MGKKIISDHFLSAVKIWLVAELVLKAKLNFSEEIYDVFSKLVRKG